MSNITDRANRKIISKNKDGKFTIRKTLLSVNVHIAAFL